MPKASTNAKPDNRLKHKGAGTGKKQSKKAAKGPNKPKRRPPSAFYVFMSKFKEQFKKENPNNKSVAEAGQAGRNKWKSMSNADKAPYIAEEEKKKEEYEENLRHYNLRRLFTAEGQKMLAEGVLYNSTSDSEVDDEEEDDEKFFYKSMSEVDDEEEDDDDYEDDDYE